MLQELGWVAVQGKRERPRNSDYRLRGEEELYELRRYLLWHMKDPEGFIGCVFSSRERTWVDRCVSIIAERPKREHGTR
jgi:hypothetical protein